METMEFNTVEVGQEGLSFFNEPVSSIEAGSAAYNAILNVASNGINWQIHITGGKTFKGISTTRIFPSETNVAGTVYPNFAIERVYAHTDAFTFNCTDSNTGVLFLMNNAVNPTLAQFRGGPIVKSPAKGEGKGKWE